MSDQHAKWLREAAEQIAAAGHNGWGNTCSWAADHIDKLVADLAAERARADGLAAARMAYAREFPPDSEGESDVGNVHANIRALKADRDRLRAAIEQAPHDDGCASLDCVLCDADVFPHEGQCHKPKPCNCWKRAALGEAMPAPTIKQVLDPLNNGEAT